MECSICEVRSSVGFCVECRSLLCETCGVPCDECGKLSCPEHIHETRRGRSLCVDCYGERKEKMKAALAERRGKHGEGDTSFSGLEAPPVGEEEGEERHRALVKSGVQPLQPWQLSVYIAGAGIVLALLLYLFPGLRLIPFTRPGIPTAYVLFVFPVLAGIWAFIGLTREDYYEDRPKSLLGLGVCLIAAVMTFAVLASGPGPTVESGIQMTVESREGLTGQELKNWREEQLRKYQRP